MFSLIFSKKSILPSSHHRGTCMCFTSFAFLVFMVREREAGWEEMRKLGYEDAIYLPEPTTSTLLGIFRFLGSPCCCHVRGDDVFVCEDVTNWIVSLHWTDKQFAKVVRTHTQLLPLAKNHHKNSQMVFDGRELQLAIQETNLHF